MFLAALAGIDQDDVGSIVGRFCCRVRVLSGCRFRAAGRCVGVEVVVIVVV